MPKLDQNLTKDDLWAVISELRAEIRYLRDENAALRNENAALRKEVKDLRSKLGTNSKNSSLPPSQDPFSPKSKRKPSGRKQGAQPGHKGHNRQKYPPGQITKTIEVLPIVCSSCGGNQFHNDPISIECKQVVELPPVIAEVTQYNIHTCCCDLCGKHQRAEVPEEAKYGYGPRLMGFLTLLSGDSQLGKRKISSLMGYLGIKISVGSVCNIHKLACDLLAIPFKEIKAEVLAQNNVNADETSWRLRSKKCWAWIGTTPGATFIEIDPSRSQAAFDRIFNGFQNTLTTDRYGAYNSHLGNKQVCLAHIDRDFTKVSERLGADGAIGRILKEQLGEIFEVWKEFKFGECSRETLQKLAQPYIESIKTALKVGASAAGLTAKTEALCYDLLVRFPTLWTFLYEEGIEPTNNLAERGLRPAVIVRKISGGSQSDWGMRFTERIMSVVFTLKQRAQNVFEYFVNCFQARARARPVPPLY